MRRRRFARAAGEALEAARHEDLNLDVLLPSARVLMETGAPEWEDGVRPYLQLSLAMVAQRTMDEDVRVRWLRGPARPGDGGARRADRARSRPPTACGTRRRTENDLLLQSLVQGKTNAEIADELGIDERAVERRLGELFAHDRRVVARGRHRVRVPGAGPVRRSAMPRARVDRHRCVGAGTCITIAPTAFDWYKGDFAKAGVVDAASVEDEVLREAALACPTGAITIEDVEELLPWQLRGKDAPRRVEKTFMFTDIESSTNLVEALGDEVWQGVLRWHNETLRSLFAEHKGEEVVVDRRRVLRGLRLARRGARVRRRDPAPAGRAPAFGGVRAEGADRPARVGRDAGREELLGQGRARGVADRGARGRRPDRGEPGTAADGRFPISEPRTVTLRGTSEPIEIVTVDWS